MAGSRPDRIPERREPGRAALLWNNLYDTIRRMDSSEIRAFIERAKASGVSDQVLVGMLTARGWPEKNVYQELAVHYERLTGIAIPSRRGSGAGAKDAFFYLLTFSVLATWTIALASLAFALIEHRFADTLFSGRGDYAFYEASSSMAAVLIAYPLYLLLSWLIARETGLHPEKLNSPVRKWLTYIALVIAAGVILGDLITAVEYLLRGEITERFLLRVLVVLLLSGGVLFYYFLGLKETEATVGPTYRRWNSVLTIASLVFVTTIVAFGFGFTGAPGTQRARRADSKRLQDLYQVSQNISGRWRANQKLPEHLDELGEIVKADPVTRTSYGYQIVGGSRYQLCATFALPSAPTVNDRSWKHPAGQYCFPLDAAEMPESPPFSYAPDL